MPYAAANLADTVVVAPPSPTTSGLSLTVANGARLGSPPFIAVVTPANTRPAVDNSEFVLVSAIAGDAVTLGARGVESTTPRAIQAGDTISRIVTAAMWNDLSAGLILHHARTGTAETLSLADATGCSMNNASASVLTVPLNATVAFPVGTTIPLLQLGAGQVTVSPVSGSVTINSRGAAYKLAGQHAAAVLIQTAVDVWNLSGDITT